MISKEVVIQESSKFDRLVYMWLIFRNTTLFLIQAAPPISEIDNLKFDYPVLKFS